MGYVNFQEFFIPQAFGPLVFAQAHIEVLEEQIVRETSRRKELEEKLGLATRDVRYDKNWFCKLLPKWISRFFERLLNSLLF